ncbi:unnamed protein product [Gordionus sp. m RMFG-2023]
MRSLFGRHNAKIYLISINIYVILLACHEELDWKKDTSRIKGFLDINVLTNGTSSNNVFSTNASAISLEAQNIYLKTTKLITLYLSAADEAIRDSGIFDTLTLDDLSYHKETPSLVSFNFSVPFDHLVQTYMMDILTMTRYDGKITKIRESRKFTNLPFKYNFSQQGNYKLSFQYKICNRWVKSLETIEYIRIDSDFIVFANLSTYKNKRSLLLMVFPRNLKEEAIKNGSILKRDSRINIVMMAYHHIAKITEARKNITYIILYKTAQMIKPRIKCVFNQESKMKKGIYYFKYANYIFRNFKKPRVIRRMSFDNIQKFLQTIEVITE